MSKFNIVHPTCRQDRYEAQNDGNDWHIDENNEPVEIVGAEVFDKLGLERPLPNSIPFFKTERPVNWIKVAKEADMQAVLADGGEAALLIAPDAKLGGSLGIKR